MHRMTAWRMFAGVGAALVLATGLYASGVPIGDPCAPCAAGTAPWWICLLAGCW